MFSAGINGYNVARGLFGALKTRAPRPELIDQLLDQADMTGCLAALKNLPLVESIPTGQGPAEMETALRYACAVLALKIRRVLGGPAGRFLEAYTWHYDFHNIKLIFRSSLDGGVFDLPSGLYPLGEVYSIGPLKKIGAPEDLPTYFAETPLAPAVNEAWELFAANNSDLSLFELGLDKWYVNLVWNAAEHVRPTEGSRLRDRILAPWLGMVCLLWVLWLKNFRSMGVEEPRTVYSSSRETGRRPLPVAFRTGRSGNSSRPPTCPRMSRRSTASRAGLSGGRSAPPALR
jgi:hypothetical protein